MAGSPKADVFNGMIDFDATAMNTGDQDMILKQHHGECHCGAIKLTLSTVKEASDIGARACQCTFCLLHGASWTSDPNGTLAIAHTESLLRYRLGTQSAEFLVCGICGVATAIAWDSGRLGLLGVLRVECMGERQDFKQARVETNFDGETVEQRFMRRSRNWTPASLERVK